MRYFEIAKALARYILADADGKAPSGNHAALVERDQLEIWVRGRLESVGPALQFSQSARPT